MCCKAFIKELLAAFAENAKLLSFAEACLSQGSRGVAEGTS
jgi:hypothetical protein